MTQEITLSALRAELANTPDLIVDERVDDGLLTVTHQLFGDISLAVTVTDEQVLLYAPVVPVSAIQADKLPAALTAALRLSVLLPLTAVGLMQVAGEEHFVVFGQISCVSTLETVIEELHAAAEGAVELAEVLHDFI